MDITKRSSHQELFRFLGYAVCIIDQTKPEKAAQIPWYGIMVQWHQKWETSKIKYTRDTNKKKKA